MKMRRMRKVVYDHAEVTSRHLRIDLRIVSKCWAPAARIDYEPEDVTAAFKAFARNAPDGMIRVHDLREALRLGPRAVVICGSWPSILTRLTHLTDLRTYMHAEVSDSQVEELLQHYKDLRPIDVDHN